MANTERGRVERESKSTATTRILLGCARALMRRNYSIDHRIPPGYLISAMFRRASMMLRGLILFRRSSTFVSWSAILRCRGRIVLRGRIFIDDDSLIDALSTDGILLGSGVNIGRRCAIECTGSVSDLGKGLVVGDRVSIGSDSFFGCAGGIEIGDATILGNFVSLHSENHVFSDPFRPILDQGVTRQGIRIGSGCWIGAKATILDGAKIGNNCVVAAGAVVAAGIYPDYVLLGGVPAKILRRLDVEYAPE